MSETVTLTLTGAKRFMISGTTHTVEQWQQCRVDDKTAQHLLDQYFTDKNNQEQPYFEEGVIDRPVPRADRKRVRASQRRLDREAQKAVTRAEAQSALRSAKANGEDMHSDAMQQFRQDAGVAQDPYNRTRGEDAPDWAVNTDVAIGPAITDEDAEPIIMEATPRPKVDMQVDKPKPTPRKRVSKKTRSKKAAAA